MTDLSPGWRASHDGMRADDKNAQVYHHELDDGGVLTVAETNPHEWSWSHRDRDQHVLRFSTRDYPDVKDAMRAAELYVAGREE